MAHQQSRVYAYLRASTKEQDAQRARGELEGFATDKGLAIAAWFIENESGAKLERPELFCLLEVAMPSMYSLLSKWIALAGWMRKTGKSFGALSTKNK